MPLGQEFELAARQKTAKHRRPPPFSLRLSKEERARLVQEAEGQALGAYIKAKVLTTRTRRVGNMVEDRAALAQALALLGRSRLASNLNQLAHLAHVGALALTPEIESELSAAYRDIQEIRQLLLVALGMKAELTP